MKRVGIGVASQQLLVHSGAQVPTREGLGAGGQRPSERHGFFDYTTRLRDWRSAT